MAERSGARSRYQVLNRLYEPGIERVYPHTGAGFVVLGAVQEQAPIADLFTFDRMKGEVFRFGARYIELDGVWLCKLSGEVVHEPVLFVPYPGADWGPWSRFGQVLAEIVEDYGQAGMVVCDGRIISLHWSDGRRERLGVFEPELITTAYARVSNLQGACRLFSFAGVRVPGSAIEALAMQKSGNLLAEGRVFFELK